MKTYSTSIRRFCLPALPVVLALLALLVLPACAHAQLAFTLTPDTLSGQPGDTLTFSGTLTNQGTDELFLTADLFTLSGADLTLDDSPFLNNFPLSLLGGETASGDMFTIAIGAGAPQDLFPGSFTILGGFNNGDTDTLATQRFSVAVPEPGSLALLLGSGVGLGFLAQRRKRVAGMQTWQERRSLSLPSCAQATEAEKE